MRQPVGFVLLAALAALLALAGFRLVRDLVPEPTPAAVGSEARVDALAAEIRELRRELATQQPLHPTASEDNGARSDLRPLAEELANVESTGPSTSTDSRHAALVAKLESRLREEGRDGQASDTERTIADVIGRWQGVALEEAHCTHTACRVRVRFTDEHVRDSMLENIGMTPPFDTHLLLEHDAERRESTIYVARSGQSLY